MFVCFFKLGVALTSVTKECVPLCGLLTWLLTSSILCLLLSESRWVHGNKWHFPSEIWLFSLLLSSYMSPPKLVTSLIVESRMTSLFSFLSCNHCPLLPVNDFFFPFYWNGLFKGIFVLCFETFQILLMNCFHLYWMSHESKAPSCRSTMSNARHFLEFPFRRL